MADFDVLQTRLPQAWSVHQTGSTTPHVVVALPSLSMAPTVLAHYAPRLPALEHRFLLSILMLPHVPGCELFFVGCEDPGSAVLQYYGRLASPAGGDAVLERLRLVVVPDQGGRAVADKLLEREDLVAGVRQAIGDRPAMIEPWNVTAAEVEVALRLGVPVNGTHPRLWAMGFKSAGRRLLRDCGVPVPHGREDVRTVDEAAAAVEEIRSRDPQAPAVVVKHDNSGAGNGNLVFPLHDEDGRPVPAGSLASRLGEAMPAWFRRDLASGSVVEELISGDGAASPSVQIDITPFGDVEVASTHEQLLSGDTGQVYAGCRLPADPAYAAELARHARTVGERLARSGARGRVAVDFMAVRRRGGWHVYALEVNLRKGGTTWPHLALRHLVPGRYHEDSGQWQARDGSVRCYQASDTLASDAWRALDPAAAIAAVAAAGLDFDHRRGTGVVLHMLSGLRPHGLCGQTAIGRTPQEAAELYQATHLALDAQAARVAQASSQGSTIA